MVKPKNVEKKKNQTHAENAFFPSVNHNDKAPSGVALPRFQQFWCAIRPRTVDPGHEYRWPGYRHCRAAPVPKRKNITLINMYIYQVYITSYYFHDSHQATCVRINIDVGPLEKKIRRKKKNLQGARTGEECYYYCSTIPAPSGVRKVFGRRYIDPNKTGLLTGQVKTRRSDQGDPTRPDPTQADPTQADP